MVVALQMPTNLRAEKIKRDRNSAAIHEAGHAVVALVLGCERVELSLKERHIKNWKSERNFFAHAKYLSPIGKYKLSASGFAGSLAEILYNEPDIDKKKLTENFVVIGKVSRTDMKSIYGLRSPAWRTRALRHAYAILKKDLITVRRIAYQLATNHRGFIIVERRFMRDPQPPGWEGRL